MIELPTPSRWRPPAHPRSGGLRTPGKRASNFHPAVEGQTSSGSNFADLLRNGLRRIAEASWRRRYLLLTPVLAMLPLSLAAALVLPRSYETSALLLLQESARNNPFASESVSSEVIQQKVPGLEALLKSEQVLAPAIHSMQAAGLRKQENDLPAAIHNLRRSLSVELIGTDFLAIRLSGPKPQGLGQELSIVLSNFLEALLSGPSGNAAQIVLTKQQQQILSLEQEKVAMQQELAKAAGTNVEGRTNNNGGSVDMSRQLIQLEQQLISARQTYDSLAKRYPQATAGPGPGILNAPGRIKIVDPPQDPTMSTTSRLKFLLGGIAAGLLLGVALAWAAELFDPIIYERDELVSVTGLPLLAVLGRTPQLSGSGPPMAMGAKPRSRARPILFTIVAIGLLGLVYVLAFGRPTQIQTPNWLSSIATPKTTPVVEP